jgi:hypothetical protein
LIKERIKITEIASGQLLLDQTINMCRLEIEKRSNMFLKLFIEVNEQDHDLSFLKCPLNSGQYIIRKGQKVPQRSVNIPKLLPFNVKVNIQFSITAKINRKIELLYSASEDIELSKI